ncbi:MAG: sensor histidine kinase [Limosilactobacillus sp.]
MIKKVRHKFILISVLGLLVVLVTIIGSISFASFYRSNREVNNVLTILLKNDGQINRAAFNRPRQPSLMVPQQTREGIFQYRFFSSQLDRQGNVLSINDSHIETVPDSAINNLSEIAFHRGRRQGTVRYRHTFYAYKMKWVRGHYTIIFLDKSILMAESYAILNIAIVFGLISMLLYTLVLVLLSKRAIKPLIMAEQRQREFISNAGHELKTPLTVISANTEMQELTSGETEWTRSNKDQVGRLTRLINNLISLTRIGEQPDMHLTRTDISPITTHNAEAFKTVMQQSQLKFNMAIQPQVMATVDVSFYAELVNILLDNASKYCDAGGSVDITLRHNKWGKAAVLTVSNTYTDGEGVDYSKFFERFYRQDTAHQQKGGFGIGLSMAQRIVNDFHGRIQAKYRDGKISFIVTLRSPAK